MTNSEKTTVFNLIVLDESGSMSGVVESTVSGCNETIDVAKAARKGNPDKMNQFVSIFAFQSGDPDHPSRYILRNKKVDDVKHITKKTIVRTVALRCMMLSGSPSPISSSRLPPMRMPWASLPLSLMAMRTLQPVIVGRTSVDSFLA